MQCSCACAPHTHQSPSSLTTRQTKPPAKQLDRSTTCLHHGIFHSVPTFTINARQQLVRAAEQLDNLFGTQVTSKFTVVSTSRDDVNGEIMCTSMRFKLVHDAGSMPKLQRLTSHIDSLSNMTVTSKHAQEAPFLPFLEGKTFLKQTFSHRLGEVQENVGYLPSDRKMFAHMAILCSLETSSFG